MATIECRKIGKTLSDPPYESPEDLLRRAFGWSRPQVAVPRFRIADVDLTIPHGKVMVILGPSGCGKSTLLRMVGGLVHPDSGAVLYDGADMSEVAPEDRNIGMVFQDYALYPHLSSEENVLSFFRFKRRAPELDAQVQAKLRKTSELLGVDMRALVGKLPRECSGGERQRIALGRCITRDPALFLLDEPFSNLDQQLRERYRVHLKLLLQQYAVTTLYVTHDQREALLLADLVALMNGGRIEQVGAPLEIYRQPRTLFAAEFLHVFDSDTGAINLLDGEQVDPAYRGFTVGVRPEDLALGAGGTVLQGRVRDVRYDPLRAGSIATAQVGERSVEVRLPHGVVVRPDQEVALAIRRLHLFDPTSGLRVRTVEGPSLAGG